MAARDRRRDSLNRNIKLLYGFSFFDPFMIVIPLWVPYLPTLALQDVEVSESGEGPLGAVVWSFRLIFSCLAPGRTGCRT